MKKAAKTFIIIGMVIQFYLIFPLVVGGIALKKLKTAKSKRELQTISIMVLLFCSLLGGIFMLQIDDRYFSAGAQPKIPNVEYRTVSREVDRSKRVIFKRGTHVAACIFSAVQFACTIVAFTMAILHYTNNYYRQEAHYAGALTMIILLCVSLLIVAAHFLTTAINSAKCYKFNWVFVILNAAIVTIVFALAVWQSFTPKGFKTYWEQLEHYWHREYYSEFPISVTMMSVAILAIEGIFVVLYMANRNLHEVVVKKVITEQVEVNLIEEELNQIKGLLERQTIDQGEYEKLRAGVIARYSSNE